MTSAPHAKTLEERIKLLEDQFAIYQLISAYGPAADSCNMKDIKRLWHEESVYEVGGLGRFEGYAGFKENFEGDFHQGVVKAGSAHISAFPHVIDEGDRAVATHYGTLYTHRDGQFVCVRLIASRWQFVRTADKGWQIMRRTNVLLDGNPEARKLLSRAMAGPDPVSGDRDRSA